MLRWCAPPLLPILEAAGQRVLAMEWVDPLGPLLHAARLEPMDEARLLSVLQRLPSTRQGAASRLQRPGALRAIHDWLRARLADADSGDDEAAELLAGAALEQLAIWPNRAGGVARGAELVEDARLRPLIGEDARARQWLDRASPTEAAAPALSALSAHMERRGAAASALALARHVALPGHPLADQAGFLSQIDRVRQLLELAAPALGPGSHAPLVDTRERLRTEPLQWAPPSTIALLEGLGLAEDLLHPELADLARGPLAPVCPRLAPAAVLDALAADPAPTRLEDHPHLADESRRARLYAWLIDQAQAIFSDPVCVDVLTQGHYFPTAQGSLLPTSQLVLDPKMPDLAIDWHPADEIPAPVLELLGRHLDLDEPMSLEELARDHLRPAYHQAAADEDGERAARILSYVASRLGRAPDARVRALLVDPSTGQAPPVEDLRGRFVPPDELFFVPPSLRAHAAAIWDHDLPSPSPARYGEAEADLLLGLGVRAHPGGRDLERALQARALPGVDLGAGRPPGRLALWAQGVGRAGAPGPPGPNLGARRHRVHARAEGVFCGSTRGPRPDRGSQRGLRRGRGHRPDARRARRRARLPGAQGRDPRSCGRPPGALRERPVRRRRRRPTAG